MENLDSGHAELGDGGCEVGRGGDHEHVAGDPLATRTRKLPA